MLYSLTDKLSFNDDPQVEIKGKIITVKSDAETVLKLLDIHMKKNDQTLTLTSQYIEKLIPKGSQTEM